MHIIPNITHGVAIYDENGHIVRVYGETPVDENQLIKIIKKRNFTSFTKHFPDTK